MVWDIAAYATALAVLAVAGVLMAAVFRLNRSLRRWDRMAIRLALKADVAFDEYVRLAQEARETTEVCRHTIGGFTRLAEGARAVGEAAESAAQAAANAATYWHDRLTFRQQTEEDDFAASEPASDLAGIVRYLRHCLRTRRSAEPLDGSRHPGASADPHSGE